MYTTHRLTITDDYEGLPTDVVYSSDIIIEHAEDGGLSIRKSRHTGNTIEEIKAFLGIS